MGPPAVVSNHAAPAGSYLASAVLTAVSLPATLVVITGLMVAVTLVVGIATRRGRPPGGRTG